MQQGPSLLRAGLIVGWSFIFLSVVWMRIADVYNGAIVSGANAFLPSDLWLSEFAGSLTVNHVAGGQEYRHGFDSLVLHSGLLIVLALVAGTPARGVAWRIAAGVFIAGNFFLVQVAALAIFALALKSSLSGTVLGGDVQIGFAIFWGLTPLIVGGALAYLFWLPLFRVPPRPLDTEDGAAPVGASSDAPMGAEQ